MDSFSWNLFVGAGWGKTLVDALALVTIAAGVALWVALLWALRHQAARWHAA